MQASLVDLATIPKFRRISKEKIPRCSAAKAKEKFAFTFTSEQRQQIAEAQGLDREKTDLVDCAGPFYIFSDGSRLLWAFSHNVGHWKVILPT